MILLARRTQRIDNSSITNLFGYDVRSQLTNALMSTNSFEYLYDNIGNRIAATNNNMGTEYTANNLNQYLSITNAISAFSPTYDADGNTTNDGTFAYSWDAENRMLSAEPLTPTNGATRLNWPMTSWGAAARKSSRHVDGSTWSASATNLWIYDGWNPISEISSAGSQVTTNWWTHGLDLSGSLQGAAGSAAS